jgi:hypothetical protein
MMFSPTGERQTVELGFASRFSEQEVVLVTQECSGGIKGVSPVMAAALESDRRQAESLGIAVSGLFQVMRERCISAKQDFGHSIDPMGS